MSGEMNEWDWRLIGRHLKFYHELASGERHPATSAQRHFVTVSQGHASPVTQHEIAYSKYLQLKNKQVKKGRTIIRPVIVKDSQLSYETEEIIDAVEEGMFYRAGRSFHQFHSTARHHVSKRWSQGKEALMPSAALFSLLSADGELSQAISKNAGAYFDNLSNAYTRAMDGAYVNGLKAGEEYVAPWLHRVVDGNHTILGSIREVKDAIQGDSVVQEISGWAQAYVSDLATPAGMPLFSFDHEVLKSSLSVLESLGVAQEWTIDALTFNLEECLTSIVPGLAVLLNWSSTDTERFREMAGSMGVAALASANPLIMIIAIVSLARAFHCAKHGAVDLSDFAAATSRGGVCSGIVLLSSAYIGGPIWIGLVTGFLLSMVARNAGSKFDGARFVKLVMQLLAKYLTSGRGRELSHNAPASP